MVAVSPLLIVIILWNLRTDLHARKCGVKWRLRGLLDAGVRLLTCEIDSTTVNHQLISLKIPIVDFAVSESVET